jgi:hypothetical protein
MRIDNLSKRDNLYPMADPALEPLKPPDAKKLARDIVENGVVEVSGHAKEEMVNDELQTTDCLNLLRAGVCEPPEYINGEWRYRVGTPRICVVFTFVSETRLRVITAWRSK